MLDTLGGAGGAWLIAALALGTAELLIPGVFVIFLAVAAAVVGAVVLVVPDLPVPAQIAAFAAWSIVTVLIGRRWYRDFPIASSDPKLNDRAARMIGEIVIVETAIGSDGGADRRWQLAGTRQPRRGRRPSTDRGGRWGAGDGRASSRLSGVPTALFVASGAIGPVECCNALL